MKLVSFRRGDRTGLGVVLGGRVAAVSETDTSLPTDVGALLAAGEAALDSVRRAIESGSGPDHALDEVELLSPIARPPKILAVGLNYKDHIEEAGLETPKVPMIFNKQSTSVVGPRAPVHRPRASDKLDYEGELAFVIGRRCRHVPRERAADVIAGYCVANDVSVRDWQMRSPTFTMGKSWDTHCPIGPWITTADEVADPHALHIETRVNGELRQESNTRHLLFDCLDLVEHLSTAFMLEPGDVVSTGTPGGIGAAMRPRRYLVPGDVVRIEIEGLGVLENPIVEEPDGTVVY
jgi:2-keto-4-pentenoate hydratase/2-oxohepta-3-ene-1,7-dioic acid hydratase in catechol pathway